MRAKSRTIYLETPANCLANHQSNCRFWAKMSLIVGLASRTCTVNGVDGIPGVREQLGRLAALEATIAALVHGQIDAMKSGPRVTPVPNRHMMYAALNWCQEHHTEIIDTLRTLMGGVPLQMPADSTVLDDPALEGVVRTLVGHPGDRSERADEALQAWLGYHRLRVRWPTSALRKILRRTLCACAGFMRPRSAVGGIPRNS